MKVVEERIAAGGQWPYIDDGALSRRHHLFAVELGALEFGRHLARVLDAQLELDAGLHIQGARLKTIVVDRKGVAGLLGWCRCRCRYEHERRGKKNSSVPKRHLNTQRIYKGKATRSRADV